RDTARASACQSKTQRASARPPRFRASSNRLVTDGAVPAKKGGGAILVCAARPLRSVCRTARPDKLQERSWYLMAFTDSRFPQTDEQPGNAQDVIPASERNQDPVLTEMTHDLTAEGSRPLTEEERKAA